MRMAHAGLLPRVLERTSTRHRTPGSAIAICAGVMFVTTGVMQMRSFAGSDMYDLLGSLSVFGFLTAYALVALALPFARRAVGQHSHLLAAVSVFTVLVLVTIAIFDLRSSTDAMHARIPWIYLAYIAAGIAWYFIRRKRAPITVS
jgi:amino acid transporter